MANVPNVSRDQLKLQAKSSRSLDVTLMVTSLFSFFFHGSDFNWIYKSAEETAALAFSLDKSTKDKRREKGRGRKKRNVVNSILASRCCLSGSQDRCLALTLQCNPLVILPQTQRSVS